MTARIFDNLRQEEGWVVVTAVIVMSLMMAIGLATYSTVDTQQTQSRVERERDSSFNLSESVLYAEGFVLGREWPTTSATAYPPECTEGDADDVWGCPAASDFQSAVDSSALPDLSSGASWTISVRDNGSPVTGTDYDDTTKGQPTFDANGDGRLWVRADAVAKGRSRSIVALLQREELGESVAQNVITAGHFSTHSNKNHVIVHTQSDSATGSQVVVRCDPKTEVDCMSYNQGKGHVSPDRVYSVPSTPNTMTTTQLDRFRAEAIANNTYWDDGKLNGAKCPPTLTGEVVFVETSYLADCKINGGTYNTEDNPGLLIFTNGVLNLHGGKATYYGFVYMLNPPDGTNTMDRFIVSANGFLIGAVSVDGRGGVNAGVDKDNIKFDGQAFAELKTHGTAGLVQNSWRELTPGS
jgi:Tfp pilus assembly protein PilX